MKTSVLTRCIRNTIIDALGKEPEFDLDEGVVRLVTKTPVSFTYGLYPTDDNGDPLPMPIETVLITLQTIPGI